MTDPVLIAGAGPAGLFAACELLRHGVRPCLVERREAPHHEARGTVLQPAVLEVLGRAGVLDPFLRDGVHVRHAQLLGPGLRELARDDFGGTGCAYDFQCCQPQWLTESIFRAHLAAQGVGVEFGTEVTAIEDAPDGLRVTMQRNGRTETIDTGYVLGTGGGHDVTRHSMHQHLGGETYAHSYFVADVRVTLAPPGDHGRVIVGPGGFVLFSPLPEDRWLIFVNCDEDDPTERPDERTLAALVDARIGEIAGLHDLRWVSHFRMHRRMADRLSDGRRFLLGDAGHLSSPMGGEGLNAALMDAADIGWKLALVARGKAKPSLLGSYAIERGLADRHVLDVSDETHRLVMKLIAICEEAGAPTIPQRDTAQRLAALRKRFMLDVSYAGSPLVGEAGESGGVLAAGERFPGRQRIGGESHHLIVFGGSSGLADFSARWGDHVSVVDGAESEFDAVECGVPEGGAILVRPDGFIGFRAAPMHEPNVAALHAHLETYLIARS